MFPHEKQSGIPTQEMPTNNYISLKMGGANSDTWCCEHQIQWCNQRVGEKGQGREIPWLSPIWNSKRNMKILLKLQRPERLESAIFCSLTGILSTFFLYAESQLMVVLSSDTVIILARLRFNQFRHQLSVINKSSYTTGWFYSLLKTIFLLVRKVKISCSLF